MTNDSMLNKNLSYSDHQIGDHIETVCVKIVEHEVQQIRQST